VDEVTYCCSVMQGQAELTCEQHPGPGQCGDHLIAYMPARTEFGLWIHDGEDGGASSYVVIGVCPWCGSLLPHDGKRLGKRVLALDLP
jgi:hypothetical protein